MEVKIYLEIAESKEKKVKYAKLWADLGYRGKVLTYDINDIAEYIGVPVGDLYTLEVGKKIEVGTLYKGVL